MTARSHTRTIANERRRQRARLAASEAAKADRATRQARPRWERRERPPVEVRLKPWGAAVVIREPGQPTISLAYRPDTAEPWQCPDHGRQVKPSCPHTKAAAAFMAENGTPTTPAPAGATR